MDSQTGLSAIARSADLDGTAGQFGRAKLRSPQSPGLRPADVDHNLVDAGNSANRVESVFRPPLGLICWPTGRLKCTHCLGLLVSAKPRRFDRRQPDFYDSLPWCSICSCCLRCCRSSSWRSSFASAQATAWWVPVAMVILTGIAGAALARWQGLRVYQRIRDDARAGRMPADALVDGFLILLAGILLITPGVVTDLVGIAFLIPPIRSLVKRGVKAWIRRNVEVRVAGMNTGFWQNGEVGRRVPAPTKSSTRECSARASKTRIRRATDVVLFRLQQHV